MPQDTQETGWIEWQGGECPVPQWVRTERRLRGGYSSRLHANGGHWDRGSVERSGDIVAYRIIPS